MEGHQTSHKEEPLDDFKLPPEQTGHQVVCPWWPVLNLPELSLWAKPNKVNRNPGTNRTDTWGRGCNTSAGLIKTVKKKKEKKKKCVAGTVSSKECMKISPACWCPTMRTLGSPVNLTALMDSFRRQSLTIWVSGGVYSTVRWDSAQHLFLLHNSSPATGGELWLESGKQGASVAEMKKNRQHLDSKWDHVTNRDGLGYDTVQADKQKSETKRPWMAEAFVH